MRGALEKADGVTRIDIKEGEKDFTVHYDPARIQPADMVAKLKAAGEDKAAIKT